MNINHALDQTAQAEARILMAKQAGIDVSAQEQQLAADKAKLQRIKAVYFPGR